MPGPPSAGSESLYCRPISSLHTPLCIDVPSSDPEVPRCPSARAAQRLRAIAPSRTSSPNCPARKARAHVAFDETWTSPSLPRAYPIVPVRGEGLVVEDIDGNLFLDFAAGHRGHLDRPLAPAGRGRDQGAGRRADPLLRVRLLPADLSPRSAASSRDSRRSTAGSGPISATPAPRSSRRRSSWRATRRSGHTWSRSSARFHGRTYGAVSLTASKAKYHAGFGPLLPGVFHAPYGRVEDLRWFDDVLFDKLAPANEVAAIIVEPIQGEGGYIVPEDGFLQGLREICDDHGILLIADEIQSGAGRTGQDVGDRALGRPARHPAHRQGHRVGHAARRDGRPGRPARVVGAGRPRLDLRRQPGRLRGGAGHDRRCSKVGSSTTPPPAATRPSRACGRSSSGSLASSRDVRGKGLMIGVEFDTAEHAEAVQWACFERGLLVLECGDEQRPDVAAAHRRPRPRWRPRCASSARPSPTSPARRGRRGGQAAPHEARRG